MRGFRQNVLCNVLSSTWHINCVLSDIFFKLNVSFTLAETKSNCVIKVNGDLKAVNDTVTANCGAPQISVKTCPLQWSNSPVHSHCALVANN